LQAIYTVIEPIATLLGWLMNILFNGLEAMGIGNIAIAIIIFTIIIRLILFPLTYKQSKMQKLNSIIAPEVRKIQQKYGDNKNDPATMQKIQEETKAVYEKYGASQFGGCLQLLIQFPILLALYRVFQRIPMYIGSIKNIYVNILSSDGGLWSNAGFAEYMSANFKTSMISNPDWNNVNDAVVGLNALSQDQWNQVMDQFPNAHDLIVSNLDQVNRMNTLFGVNVSQIPTLGLTLAALIPLLAALAQYLSTKTMQSKQEMAAMEDNPAAASMKMMTIMGPLMTAFIGFSVPAGLGIYWIATSVFQTVMQILINRHFDKIGTDKIIEKSIEKRNKKLAKKGIDPTTISKNATKSTKAVSNENKINASKAKAESLAAKKKENDKKIKDLLQEAKNVDKSSKKSSDSSKKSGPKSLADRANMVSKYNEKNNK